MYKFRIRTSDDRKHFSRLYSLNNSYHRLINITQDAQESAQGFLFMAAELKESQMFGPVEFWVNTKSFEISKSRTDEDLIDKINVASSYKWYRQQKWQCGEEVKVNEVN